MLVPMRTTLNGTEYWDKKNKKAIFYPRGTEPAIADIQTEGMVGKWSASGKIAPTEQKQKNNIVLDDATNIEQLRAFAKENNIELPANIKKEESIRKYIAKKFVDEK